MFLQAMKANRTGGPVTMRTIIKVPRRRPAGELQDERPANQPFSGLTMRQLADLMLGNYGDFKNERARRAAYRYYRDGLMKHTRRGRRPAAFWDYEPGLPNDVRDTTDDDLKLADQRRARVMALGRDFWASQTWLFESGHATQIVADAALAERRARWLAGPGAKTLRPGELKVVQDEVAFHVQQTEDRAEPPTRPATRGGS
jgi:hypothetical protein